MTMTSRLKTTALVAAALVGATAATSAAVYATEASHQVAAHQEMDASTSKAVAKDFLKLSDDGLSALNNVHAARIAIYNGDTDAAQSYIQKAQTLTATADKDATTLDKVAKLDTKDKTASDGTRFLPINAQISVQDDYALKPTESGHLQKAKAAMQQGDNKAAIEHASLIDQAVSYTYVAVPYDQLKSNIDKAAQDMKDQKYHQANLALKSVEDSVVIDQMIVDGTPAAQPAQS
jgi:hypothetical protein